MSAKTSDVWQIFAAGLDHSLSLSMYEFGALQSMRDSEIRQFRYSSDIWSAVNYCIDFDLRRINLEGGVCR